MASGVVFLCYFQVYEWAGRCIYGFVPFLELFSFLFVLSYSDVFVFVLSLHYIIT